MFKTALNLCASVLFIQTTLAASTGCGCGRISSSGGNFPIASASSYPPIGITVQSENYYEGELCVNGNLPFLGTVAVEGVVPNQGAGTVSYGCGSENVGITDEGIGRGYGCGCRYSI